MPCRELISCRLFITHILFNGADTDDSGMCLRFSFLKGIFFINKKAPAVAFFDGRFFSGERLVFGSLRQRLLSFFTRNLEVKKIIKANIIQTHSLLFS